MAISCLPFPPRIVKELLSDAIGRRGYIFLKVRGVSMSPVIEQGDTIRVNGIKHDDINVGDIIVFVSERSASPGGLIIVHRVRKIERTNEEIIFVTRGDQETSKIDKVSNAMVLGKVTHVRRNLLKPMVRKLARRVNRVFSD